MIAYRSSGEREDHQRVQGVYPGGEMGEGSRRSKRSDLTRCIYESQLLGKY